MRLSVVDAAPAVRCRRKRFDAQRKASGEGLGIVIVGIAVFRMDQPFRIVVDGVIARFRPRMGFVQRGFVSVLIQCVEADIRCLFVGPLFGIIRAFQRNGMVFPVVLPGNVFRCHRRALQQGERGLQHELVVPPVAVHEDLEFRCAAIGGISDRQEHGAVFADFGSRMLCRILIQRNRVRRAPAVNLGRQDPDFVHRDDISVFICQYTDTGDRQAVGLSVLQHFNRFAGNAPQVNAVDPFHGHGNLFFCGFGTAVQCGIHQVCKVVASVSGLCNRIVIAMGQRALRKLDRIRELVIGSVLQIIQHFIRRILFRSTKDHRFCIYHHGALYPVIHEAAVNQSFSQEEVHQIKPFRISGFPHHIGDTPGFQSHSQDVAFIQFVHRSVVGCGKTVDPGIKGNQGLYRGSILQVENFLILLIVTGENCPEEVIPVLIEA